jgi:hypothetical protein
VIEYSGLEWARLADAACAVLRFACDSSIAGRILTVVPRNWQSMGYVVHALDDYEEGQQLQDANHFISQRVVKMYEAGKANGSAK